VFDFISIVSSIVMIATASSTCVYTSVMALVFIFLSWIAVYKLVRAALRTKFGRNKAKRALNILCCQCSNDMTVEKLKKSRELELKCFHEEFISYSSSQSGLLSFHSNNSNNKNEKKEKHKQSQIDEHGKKKERIERETTKEFRIQKLRVNKYQHKFMGSILIWLVLHIIVSILLLISSLLNLRDDYWEKDKASDIPWYVMLQSYYSCVPICLVRFTFIGQHKNNIHTQRQ